MAIQYHMPRNKTINFHEVLHLWRPHHHGIPKPPMEMV